MPSNSSMLCPEKNDDFNGMEGVLTYDGTRKWMVYNRKSMNFRPKYTIKWMIWGYPISVTLW
jgi:hypothetical protein